MLLGIFIAVFLFEPAVQAKKPPSFDRFLPKFSKTIESGNFSSYPKEDVPVLKELKKIFPKDISTLKCQQIELLKTSFNICSWQENKKSWQAFFMHDDSSKKAKGWSFIGFIEPIDANGATNSLAPLKPK